MISVIIPTLNEEYHLARLLTVLHSKDVDEVIVADGGSADQTEMIAKKFGARFTKGLAGRGVQMAQGASLARNDVLLFLHADTFPPAGFSEEIKRILVDPQVVAGAFRLGIDDRRWRVRAIEFLANLRCWLLRSPYGDQAIFARKWALTKVGGIPRTALLEDVLMVKRLKSVGALKLSPMATRTSARKWREHGTVKTTMANFSTNLGHQLGVSPDRLAVWRNWLLPRKQMVEE